MSEPAAYYDSDHPFARVCATNQCNAYATHRLVWHDVCDPELVCADCAGHYNRRPAVMRMATIVPMSEADCGFHSRGVIYPHTYDAINARLRSERS